MVEAYRKALVALGYGADPGALRYAFAGMKSDARGFMVGLAKPLDWILEVLEA